MAQGTPMKEARMERHLMRQRGAGPREINADFGFSFAPFSSVLPTPPDVTREPPAKRRKTTVTITNVEALTYKEKSTDGDGEAAPRRSPSLERPREENAIDTFAQVVKILDGTAHAAPETYYPKQAEQYSKKITARCKGTRSSVKRNRTEASAILATVPEAVTGGVPVAEKPLVNQRGRKRKNLDLDNEQGIAPSPHADVDDSFLASLKVTNRSSRSRKRREDGPETIEVPSVKVAKSARRSTNKPGGIIEVTEAVEAVARPATGRPKRQAAVEAVEKVALSLVEQAAPVDKLRLGIVPVISVPSCGKKKQRAEESAETAVLGSHVPHIATDARLAQDCAKAIVKPSETNPPRHTAGYLKKVVPKAASRQALIESDANIVRTSTSLLEKGDKQLNSVARERYDAANRYYEELRMAQARKPKTNAAKSKAKQPEDHTSQASKKPCKKRKPNPFESSPRTAVLPNIAVEALPRKKAKKSTITESAFEHDDADWLFDMKPGRAKSKNAPKVSQSRAEEVRCHSDKDMDLDDLLKSVATFTRR